MCLYVNVCILLWGTSNGQNVVYGRVQASQKEAEEKLQKDKEDAEREAAAARGGNDDNNDDDDDNNDDDNAGGGGAPSRRRARRSTGGAAAAEVNSLSHLGCNSDATSSWLRSG